MWNKFPFKLLQLIFGHFRDIGSSSKVVRRDGLLALGASIEYSGEAAPIVDKTDQQ